MSISHRDPRLTAYALGELRPEELQALRDELVSDAPARAEIEAIRRTGALLERELAGGDLPGLSEASRAQILAAAGGADRDAPEVHDGAAAQRRRSETRAPVQPARASWKRWLVAMTPPALLLALVLGTWGDEEPTLMVQGSEHNPRVPSGAPNSVIVEPRPLEVPAAPAEPISGEGAAVSQRLLAPTEKLSRKLSRLDDAPRRRALASAPAMRARRAPDAQRRVHAGGQRALALELYADPEDTVEAPSGESYSRFDENPFLRVESEPRSTFAIDVDTASYALVRRFLQSGRLPPHDAVRIEELINYFSYHYPAPSGDVPVSLVTGLGRAPWNPEHQLARVALCARPLASGARPAANLVFLIDVSGSMEAADKLGLVKYGLRQLTSTLRAQDRVSIVTYAGNSGVALPSTAGDQHDRILAAIDRLEAGGSTNGGSGIQLAYSLARQHFAPGKVNRVLLATDGDFNVGVTSEDALTELIQREARSGVFLSVLGFGNGNYQDSTLEKLADQGNGNYAYIDEPGEARKVLVEQAAGTLVTVAQDVKLQLEFNPAEVAAYRLIGYENRQLEHRDFNDDGKDAGELGADHNVTALYELIPAGQAVPGDVDALRFQRVPAERPAAKPPQSFRGQVLHVKLRYQPPGGGASQLLEQTLHTPTRALDEDFRFAAAVAELGLLLRESPHRGKASYEQVLQLAESSLGSGRDRAAREQFLELVRKARQLSKPGGSAPRDPGPQREDEFGF